MRINNKRGGVEILIADEKGEINFSIIMIQAVVLILIFHICFFKITPNFSPFNIIKNGETNTKRRMNEG